MKITEIFWEETDEGGGGASSPGNSELNCPMCGKSWLNVSEENAEFTENICDHLIFRWYEDGEPEAVNVTEQALEQAVQGALAKVDRESVINVLPEDMSDMNIWRLNERFWQNFECPGVETIVVSAASDASARHIFGMREKLAKS